MVHSPVSEDEDERECACEKFLAKTVSPLDRFTPFAATSMLRDLIRHDEDDYLFTEIRKMRDEGVDTDKSNPYSQGWELALNEVLDILDGRMTWLRENS